MVRKCRHLKYFAGMLVGVTAVQLILILYGARVIGKRKPDNLAYQNRSLAKSGGRDLASTHQRSVSRVLEQVRFNATLTHVACGQAACLSSTAYLPRSVTALISGNASFRLSASRIEGTCRFVDFQRIYREAYEARRAAGLSSCLVRWTCEKMCGGNGDRLQGLVATFLRAVAIGSKFQMDWSHPVPIESVFRLRNMEDHSPMPTSSLHVSKHERNVKKLKIRIIDRGTFRFCEWSNSSEVIVATNVAGERQDSCATRAPLFRADVMRSNGPKLYNGDRNAIGCTFWYLFAIGGKIEAALVQELARFMEWKTANGKSHSRTVAVHIRTGDKAMDVGSDRLGVNQKRQTERLMGCAQKWADDAGLNDVVFLVASDSQEVKRFAADRLPKRVFTSSTLPFHTDLSKGQERLAGTIGSWVDLFLLALADAIVLSQSGFGRSAASIGLFPASHIVYWKQCTSQ